ncbi:MAG TPA: VPLPA-CTERM sorting domain-containing protein [Gammaproteobacteria bacterium]|nr:VPLPA-CTERM sorting domain-containing protein [Gammaproteobacteria bacterium]
MKKATCIKKFAVLALIYSGNSSAAYITETLDPNDDFSNAQFISDALFTTKFDRDIDAPVSRFQTRNTSTTTPHASILGTGDTTVDYFSFQATTGGLTLDIDNGINSGGSFDSWLELYDSSFNLLSSNDDAQLDSGSQFSFRDGSFTSFSFDSFINYQITTDDLYYVVVGGNANPGGIPFGSNYTLHISSGSVITPPTNTVPLPASVWLLISGMLGLSGISRRRRQA